MRCPPNQTIKVVFVRVPYWYISIKNLWRKRQILVLMPAVCSVCYHTFKHKYGLDQVETRFTRLSQCFQRGNVRRRTNYLKSGCAALWLKSLDKFTGEEGGPSPSSLLPDFLSLLSFHYHHRAKDSVWRSMLIETRSCTMLLPNLNPRGHQPPQWDLKCSP